jgi:hypothetical protein
LALRQRIRGRPAHAITHGQQQRGCALVSDKRRRMR